MPFGAREKTQDHRVRKTSRLGAISLVTMYWMKIYANLKVVQADGPGRIGNDLRSVAVFQLPESHSQYASFERSAASIATWSC